MYPQLAARLAPWVLRALGAGRMAGSLGSLGLKAQMVSPPDANVANLPTIPYAQSNLGQTFGNLSAFLQRKAAAADSTGGGYDQAGFASAYPPTAHLAPSVPPPPMPQGINIPSLPTPPASLMNVPMPQPSLQRAFAQAYRGPFGLPALSELPDALGLNVHATGPELIQKFINALHAQGTGLDPPDRGAINGW